MRRGPLIAALAVLAVGAALPAAAQASVYCVNEPACVGAGGVNEGSDGAALQKALNSAGSHKNSGGPDTVMIGAGSYSRAHGFEYNNSEPVSIRGAGVAATTLTTPLEAQATVFGLVSSGSTLANLAIKVPAGEEQEGLFLNGGTVEGVSVSGGGGSGVPEGLRIYSGVFSGGSIEMVEKTTTLGVIARGGEILNSRIAASYGVDAQTALTLRGCIVSSALHVIEAGGANLILEDSLLDLRGGSGIGILLEAYKGEPAKATLRHLTVVNGVSGSRGLVMVGEEENASAELDDSIISGVEEPVVQHANGTGKKTTVRSEYSNFEAAKDVGKAGETVADVNPVAGSPDFVNAATGSGAIATGNWRLLAGSPLIDAGTPGSLAAGEFATDLAGNPRVANGRTDVGAYEYQPPAPTPKPTPTPVSVPVVTVPPTSVAPGGKPCVCAGPPSSLISALQVAPGAFRAAGRGSSVTHARHVGALVSFSLVSAASVRFTVERAVAGIVRGHSCVAAPRRRGRAHGCTRYRLLGAGFSVQGHAGGNSLRFSGALGSHGLSVGSYVLVATASLPGGRGHEAITAHFRVTR